MENISELRKHLRATQQTRQIANAMHLLSAARVKKSLQNMEYNLTYMQKLHEVMADILFRTPGELKKLPFFKQYDEKKPLYVVMTSDKGLCGGYHAVVVNKAIEEIQKAKNENFLLTAVGSKGDQLLREKGFMPDSSMSAFDKKTPFAIARLLTQRIIKRYQISDINEVYVVYDKYINAAVQKPVCKRILPFLQCDFEDERVRENGKPDLLYEPDAQTVLNHLAPRYLTGLLADILIQDAACEHAARMAAMQNATKNADEMVRRYQTKINAIRQLMITNEVTEIAAAADMDGAV